MEQESVATGSVEMGSVEMGSVEKRSNLGTGKQPVDMSKLIQAALAAAELSYSPYSHFRVGSALLLANGEIVTGTNVENVSFGLTICAERSALVRAIAQFGPRIRVVGAAVVNLNQAPSPPCGACRQVLAEFTEPDAPISFPADRAGTVEELVLPFHELLPYGFDLKLK